MNNRYWLETSLAILITIVHRKQHGSSKARGRVFSFWAHKESRAEQLYQTVCLTASAFLFAQVDVESHKELANEFYTFYF